MDGEREQQEWRAITRWLRGEKPPAAGRRWQRMAEAIVPPVVRTACQQTLGAEAGDVVACVVTGLVPLLCAGILFFAGDTMVPVLGESESPLRQRMHLMIRSIRFCAGTAILIACVVAIGRLILGR
jgi:hypothetical protein